MNCRQVWINCCFLSFFFVFFVVFLPSDGVNERNEFKFVQLNTETKHRISNRYNLREESMQPYMVKESRLILEFSAREISLALIHCNSGKLLFLNNLSVVSSGNADLPDFEKIIGEHQTLLENVYDIALSWKTPEFTMVPQTLFDSRNMMQLLRSGGCDPEPNELCFASSKPVGDYMITYSIPEKVVGCLNPFKNKSHYFSSVYPLINSALQSARGLNQRIVLVNVFDEAFEVVVAEPRKVLFCNSFPFRSPEDFVYFLLLVSENLSIDNDKDLYFFCGQIEKNSTVFQLCNKYIRNTKWMGRPEGIEFGNVFSSLPAHFFHSFFQLFHCV